MTNAVVVSPDIGHAKRALKLAQALGLPAAAGEKRRVSDTKVVVDGIMGDVQGKRIFIVDDEIATAGTIVELVNVLRSRTKQPITVLGTHGLFTGPAVERLNAVDEIDEIIVTNTVELPPERRPKRLRVLSVAHIFGEVIRRNVLGKSVGALFEFWPASDREGREGL